MQLCPVFADPVTYDNQCYLCQMHTDLFVILASMEIKPAWWKVAWLHMQLNNMLYSNNIDFFFKILMWTFRG